MGQLMQGERNKYKEMIQMRKEQEVVLTELTK
jgi:hypothetical protein